MHTSNRKLSHFILLGLLVLLFEIQVTSSCSLIRTTVSSAIKTADAGEKVIARTMELGSRFLLRLWEFVVMPQKNAEYAKLITSFLLVDDIPSHLTKYDPTTDLNQYGMVVISAPLGKGTPTSLPKINIITEGQNEKGLSISGLVLTTSRYQSLDVNPCAMNTATQTCSTSTLLSWMDVIPYLLSRATTAEDAIEELQKVVVYRPEQGSGMGIHWALDDSTGAQYIVEYLNGELVYHDSTLGVMTNDPGFSWHVQNLNRYGYIKAAKPEIPAGMMFKQPTNVYPIPPFDTVPHTVSHGTAAVGIPGDISPPSRFVKLFYMRSLAEMHAVPLSYLEALALANSLISSVAIPYGSVGGPVENAGDDSGMGEVELLVDRVRNLLVDTELAQWTVLKVPRKNVVFYRDYVHSTWKEVKLGDLDFTSTGSMKKWKIYDSSEAFGVAVKSS